MLENGERRPVMEAILGRKVGKNEMEKEAELPYAERMRLALSRREALEGRRIQHHQ